MNHPPQKAQPFGGIIAVPTDVVLRDLGVQSEKGIYVPGLGEDVSRVAKLRSFDDVFSANSAAKAWRWNTMAAYIPAITTSIPTTS